MGWFHFVSKIIIPKTMRMTKFWWCSRLVSTMKLLGRTRNCLMELESNQSLLFEARSGASYIYLRTHWEMLKSSGKQFPRLKFKFNLCRFDDISIFPYVCTYLLVIVFTLFSFFPSHINLLKGNKVVIIIIICINEWPLLDDIYFYILLCPKHFNVMSSPLKTSYYVVWRERTYFWRQI